MAAHRSPSNGSPPGVATMLTVVCAMLSACMSTDIRRQTEAIDNAGRLDGGLAFTVPSGDYYVGALEDKIGDARYQPGGPGSSCGDPTTFMVRSHEAVRVETELTAASITAGTRKLRH